MAHADPDRDSATLALPITTDEQPPALSDELADLARESDIDAEHGIASNTRRAYNADWRGFTTFCTKHGLRALPATPQTVALYYAALKKAGKKYATIDRARAGIRHVHRQHGYTSPTDDPETGLRLRGIAKQITKKSTQKAPLLDDLLRRVVQAIDRNTLVGKRDHALLVLGWCTAMRRSAICNINVDHVRWTYDDDGVEILELFVPSSKTDQLGLGKTKRIPHFDDPDIEPIAAVRAWLTAIGNPTDGPLFLPLTPDGKGVIARRLNDKTVARIVKKYAELLGFAGDFAGHSLKRGVLSTGARAQLSMNDLMKTGDHVTPQLQYYEDAQRAVDLPITRIVQRKNKENASAR